MLGALAGATLMPAALPAAFAAQPAQEALKDIARRKGLRFGTAVGAGTNQFGDPAYRALVERECGLIVPENELKWQAVQPTPAAHRFEQADAMLAWADKSGMATRGHTLFWQAEKWMPSWLAKADLGASPRAGAERLMREHVRAVCGHYGKRIASWDVVNEAVANEDGKLRQNTLTRPLGAIEQIELAFRLAREHAPHAELVYNDYMGPGSGSAKHRAGVLSLLAELKKRGAPVDALGLQSHIHTWESAAKATAELAEWRRFLEEVSGMGYGLVITELDVNDREQPADIAKRDAGVAAATRAYLDTTLSFPRLRDVLVWGMSDDISWLQTWKEAKRKDGLAMRPCPYDAKRQAKPMRQAIAEAMAAAPLRA